MTSSDLFLDKNSKENFLTQLPDLLVSARQTWNKISQDQWSDVSLAKLYDLVTDITSLSALHDMDDTHTHSHAIQEYLGLFLNRSTQPSNKQITDINNLFEKLEVSQKHNQVTLLQTLDKNEPILLFSNNGEVIPNIEARLAELDFKFISNQSIDSVAEQIKKDDPRGIVLETSEISDLEKLNELLSNENENYLKDIPIIMISSEGNLQLRLSAMRSGINRYFCAPQDINLIIDEIKSLFEPDSSLVNKVLIIEDDPTQAEFASSILQKASMNTLVVTNPLKVMDSLMSFQPDIILMDIYMPDANGLELTSVIRDDLRYQATPIVFLSGETDQEKQLNALLLGADDFIMKPIRPKVLIATIQNRIKRTQDLIHAIKLECSESQPGKRSSENQPILKPGLLGDSTDIEEQSELNDTTTPVNATWENKLTKAINEENLRFFYQPILCIGGISTDNYSIIVKYKDSEESIGWYGIVKSLQDEETVIKMDQQIARKSVAAMIKLKSEDKSGYVFFPQSYRTIKDDTSAGIIRDTLKSSQIPGTGIVIELRFSSMVSIVKEAHAYIKKVKALGCKVCISEFPAKKAAFKILNYLKADFVKVSSRLLETESSVINTYVNQAHKIGCHVIVANISDPQKINLHWTTVADYLQGEFISPEGEEMNFNFSQSAL